MNTIIQEKSSKTIIEKSKFITYVFKCESMENQIDILKRLRKEHSSATHICYASIFDDNGLKYYFDDDGEPSSTAGLPILQTLREFHILNVICVVVRYFGGIKLGANNLGRAYKDCAYSCLENNICTIESRNLYKIECTYSIFNQLKLFFYKNSLKYEKISFDKNVCFEIYLNELHLSFIKKRNVNLLELNKSRYFIIG